MEERCYLAGIPKRRVLHAYEGTLSCRTTRAWIGTLAKRPNAYEGTVAPGGAVPRSRITRNAPFILCEHLHPQIRRKTVIHRREPSAKRSFVCAGSIRCRGFGSNDAKRGRNAYEGTVACVLRALAAAGQTELLRQRSRISRNGQHKNGAPRTRRPEKHCSPAPAPSRDDRLGIRSKPPRLRKLACV